MRKSTILIASVFLVVMLTLGGLNLSSVFAQTPGQGTENGDMRRTISVSGAGEVSAQPDTAIIVIGVQTEAEEASAALSQNNQQVNDLINTLQQAGIAQADIQTQRINLFPRYAEQPEQTGQPEVTGYQATNTVQVRVRDISQVGQVLDTAVQARSNLIENISFTVSDQEEALQQAREAAFDDARQKAEQLAGLAGVQLGELVSITETSISPPRPFAVGGQAEEAAMAVPVEPGTQNIQVNLQVTWEITGGQAAAVQRTVTPIVPQTGVEGDPTPVTGSPTPTNAISTAEVDQAGTPTTEAAPTEINPIGSAAAEQLREQGAAVQEQGTIQQPFFPVTGRLLVVNGESVQVFEFDNAVDAQGTANIVSQASTQAGDLFAANVYHADNSVILYFGNDQFTLDLLSETFGNALTN